MSERITHRLTIRGTVQGVFYRESMRAEAARLGIAGWVRNRADGSVEAIVQGSPQSVASIVDWARRGPPDAQVTDVSLDDAEGEFTQFEKRSTK